jgi:hypothetical protein
LPLVVLALLFLIGSEGPARVAAQIEAPGAAATARAFVAREHGLPLAALSVVHRARAADPVTGRPQLVFKVLDARTGRTYSAALDAGNPRTAGRRWSARVRAALLARRSRVDGSLADRLRLQGSGPSVPVIVWLKEPRPRQLARPPAKPAPGQELGEAEARAFVERAGAERESAVAPLVAPVAARLRGLGHVPRPLRHVPALALDVPSSAVNTLAAWAEVDRVYLDVLNEPELDQARPSLKSTIVSNRGYNGTGVKVAMIEVGGRVAPNDYLEISQDPTTICASPSEHSTGVAGLINSNHPVTRGIAPGARLWVGGSCTGSSSQLQSRANAAANWGARVLNLSWGASATTIPGGNDRFFDDMVLNRHIFVVKSAGNRAGPCQGDAKITSPGLAFNVLTVGGYDDRNTVQWTDDIMDDCSSHLNPTSANDDREKPEIVAPSMHIDSTTPMGVGDIGSGTSFAAGMVTGVVAQLMQRAPSLQFWPEALKAILMATAVHNVEGDRRISDKDGVGGLSVDRADDVARGFRGDWDGMEYECDENTPGPTVNVPMALVAGRRTRAVIVWNADPAYELYELQPGADLDVNVLDPSATVVATSASLDNTYEIVDFVPATAGTYTLQITASRCDVSPRALAYAWWRAG